MSKRKRSYVTADDCSRFRTEIKSELSVLRNALVGEDLRGGLVKDVSDIKAVLSTARSVKEIVVPVAVAVASSVITAWILSTF